mmetsp:Transcript_44828/g.101202  ORF Transcript_44828/g.101202 Transcript_44828/m.101202 type:complete len:236 (+) Transcript_44828:1416-2123(+)
MAARTAEAQAGPLRSRPKSWSVPLNCSTFAASTPPPPPRASPRAVAWACMVRSIPRATPEVSKSSSTFRSHARALRTCPSASEASSSSSDLSAAPDEPTNCACCGEELRGAPGRAGDAAARSTASKGGRGPWTFDVPTCLPWTCARSPCSLRSSPGVAAVPWGDERDAPLARSATATCSTCCCCFWTISSPRLCRPLSRCTSDSSDANLLCAAEAFFSLSCLSLSATTCAISGPR